MAGDRSRPAKQASFAIARFLLEANRVDEATEVIQRSLTKWPRDSVLLNLKGVLLKRRGRLSEAIQAFKQACNADPRQAGALFNLANSYLAIGDATKAAVTFVKVIAREPKNSEAHRLYAQALQQLGDVEKAEASFRAALLINPQNISAALGLASLLDDLVRYSEAIGILDEAIAKNGETAELARAKTILLRHSGRIDQSINYLVDLITRQPKAAWAHHLLGLNSTPIEKRQTSISAEHTSSTPLIRSISPTWPTIAIDLGTVMKGLISSRPMNLPASSLRKDMKSKLTQKCCGIFSCDAETLQLLRRSAVSMSLESSGRSKGTRPPSIFFSDGSPHPNSAASLSNITDSGVSRSEQNAGRSPLKHVNRRVGVRAKFRVGFMSSDLRSHPVSYFVLPLLEGYDRSQFEFYCYSFYTGEEDAVQKRIRQRVDMFRLAPGVSPREAAQIIADDDLDIVFELGGTTAHEQARGNGLEACATSSELAWISSLQWAYDHRRNPGRPLSQTAGSRIADREAFRTSPQLGHSWPAKLSIWIAD